jgi:hypothetical protein
LGENVQMRLGVLERGIESGTRHLRQMVIRGKVLFNP